LKISGLQPPTAAALVADDGARYPAAGITLVSGPHVLETAHSGDHERSNRSIMNTESGDHEHAPAVS
jgi:hypothetical protein